MLLSLGCVHRNYLDAFYSTLDVLEALREILATRRLGEAWKRPEGSLRAICRSRCF